jgi:hypothetical protein
VIYAGAVGVRSVRHYAVRWLSPRQNSYDAKTPVGNGWLSSVKTSVSVNPNNSVAVILLGGCNAVFDARPRPGVTATGNYFSVSGGLDPHSNPLPGTLRDACVISKL